MKLSKSQLLGVLRHVLTFTGGVLVTQGLLETGVMTEFVGGIMTLAGAVWSVIEKKSLPV